VVAEALRLLGYSNLFYAELTEMTNNPYQLEYAGLESDQAFPWHKFDAFALGVGDNRLRKKMAALVKDQGKSLLTVKHPNASISLQTKIGDGAFIARNVSINPLASIGEGVIINTAAVIEHECTVDDYAHIAPAATLAGDVTVQPGAFVGANAVLKQGVTIGTEAVVGAGSVVLENVENFSTVVGVPAKPIRYE
jgi:sugar O-acyltransferase (sialic acid O-acetyltransferase NeuD family)